MRLIADFNGDGRSDAISAGDVVDEIQLHLSSGSGYAPAQSFLTGNAQLKVSDLASADFDGDGFDDLLVNSFVANLLSSAGVIAAPPRLLRGSVGGLTAPQPTLGLPSTNFERARVADLDNDGDSDIVLFGYDSRWGGGSIDPAALTILDNVSGVGNVAFATGAVLNPLGGARQLVVSDFDDDGQMDILSSFFPGFVSTGSQIELRSGNGAFAFAAAALQPGLSAAMTGFPEANPADFNGDGLLDLVFEDEGFGLRVLERLPDAYFTARGTGSQSNPLLIDGSSGGAARQTFVNVGAPFTVNVQAPPGAPNAAFAIWGSIGSRDGRRHHPGFFGPMAVLPHFYDPTSTSLFTLANSIAPDPRAFFRPAPGNWTQAGIVVPIPLVFTLHGVIQDPASPLFGIALTNAVTVTVE